MKLNVPGEDFVTDGHYFLSMQSDYWPRDITFTLSDLLTREQKPLYLGGTPSPDAILISGDYLVYFPDPSAGISDAADQIHVYNLSSETEDLIENNEEGYSRYLQNIWGDILACELGDPAKRSNLTPPRFETINLKTHETESLQLPEGSNPSWVYPPYAVLPEYNEASDKILIKLATLEMPPVVQSIAAVSSTEQMVLPESTRAGSPLAMTFGLITFALACVLAIIWRNK
ncbi:hypothetical protein [Methanorbis furvi]|uniref:hypothetical protein n=1 Tax=Methanorbis furvi TaxID=3028299 RepID=UPI0030B8C46C